MISVGELSQRQAVGAVEDEVYKKINRDTSFEEAVRGFYDELLESPTDLVWWWRQLGVRWIRSSLDQARRSGAPAQARRNGSVIGAKSWKEELERVPERILDLSFAVGSSGNIKPLGQFTKEDVMQRYQHFSKTAETLAGKAKIWHTLYGAMPDGSVVAEVYGGLDEELRLSLAQDAWRGSNGGAPLQ